MFSPGTSPIRRWREFPWGWWRCRCWRPPKSPRSSVRRCPTCHCWMAASGMLEDNKTHQNTRCSGDHSRSIFCTFSMFCMLFVLTSHWQGFHCVRGILNQQNIRIACSGKILGSEHNWYSTKEVKRSLCETIVQQIQTLLCRVWFGWMFILCVRNCIKTRRYDILKSDLVHWTAKFSALVVHVCLVCWSTAHQDPTDL